MGEFAQDAIDRELDDWLYEPEYGSEDYYEWEYE